MGRSRAAWIEFTGQGSVKVKEFLGRMEWWFTTMGNDFDGETEKSKKMRVAQLHLACPMHSVTGKFISTLERTVCSDEALLKAALIDHFHDAEWEGQADEDILTAMSTLCQGSQDVFKYSRKVLKLLQWKPKGLQSYDRILIGYYLDGLTSRRPRELAILRSSEHDCCETPFQVVKSVMRLATRLKIKGYRRHGSTCSDAEDEDEDEDEDDDDDDDGYNAADTDSGSDADGDYYGHSRHKRKVDKMAMAKRVRGRKDKRMKSKERKSHKSHENKGEAGGEISKLREMIRDLKQIQKQIIAPGTGVVAGRTGEDVIPLDTYTVGQGYGRYPYGLRDASHPNARPTVYPDRHGEMSQPVDYYQERRGEYPASQKEGHQGTGRIGPPTHSYFDNFTRQRQQGSGISQQSNPPPRTYPSSGAYGNTPESEPIVDPNGALYYQARPRRCYHCLEEGHIRPQCPRLRSSIPRMVTLGPEHPDTLARPLESSAQAREKPVNVVEVAARSSALEGMKVREVTATAMEDPAELTEFVCKIGEVDGDDYDESDGTEEEEEEEEAAPVMAGEKARRFSELSSEFDGEAGPATQRRRHEERDDVAEITRKQERLDRLCRRLHANRSV